MPGAIGMIGLGNAGAAICKALSGKTPLLGFDLNPARREAVADLDMKVVDSVGQIGSTCDFVMLSLPKPAASIAVVKELAAAEVKPSIVIETSTVTPETAKQLDAICREAGMRFVDAAIAGGIANMAAGKICFLCGGSESDLAYARTALELVAVEIIHLGPVGAGMGTKVVNNGVMHAVMVVLIEAFAMAEKLGISSRQLIEILKRDEGLMRPLTHRVEERMLSGNYQGGMSVANARKDSMLALETAQDLGVPLFAHQSAHTPYEIAEGLGMGDLDYSSLARLWEEWSKVQFAKNQS